MTKITPRKAPKTIDKVIHPPYKCFCCSDTGLVAVPAPLYDDYFDGDIEIPMICTRAKCEIGRKYYYAWHSEERSSDHIPTDKYRSLFDCSLPSHVAEEIHQRGYQLWQKTMMQGLDVRAKKAALIANTLIEEVSF